MPNAKVLESKKATVEALAEKLQNATAAVFVDYKGINVAQDTELRNQFRAAGVEYTVVKNTLTRFDVSLASAPRRTRISLRSRAAWSKVRFCPLTN